MTPIDELHDHDRPYSRFYRDPETQAILQIHTRKIEGLGFGRAGWRLTASVAGEDGLALVEGGEPMILAGPNNEPLTFEFMIQADAATTDIQGDLEAVRVDFARLAARANDVWRAAQDVQ